MLADASAAGSGRLQVRETVTREYSYTSCVGTTVFKQTTVRVDDAVAQDARTVVSGDLPQDARAAAASPTPSSEGEDLPVHRV